MQEIDAAINNPLLTVAEINLDLAAKRVTRACRCVVTPSVTKADALAALDTIERHSEGCTEAIHALRSYLAEACL